MFHFFRKHQALALIFIGIVIVSFVIFFSPNQKMGRGGMMDGGALGTINGRLVERGEYFEALREAELGHRLRTGEWPSRGSRDWDETRDVIQRLTLLDAAERLGVRVTDEVAAARIVELPFLQDEKTGVFSRAAYDQLLAFIQQHGLTRVDFERFMRHEVAINHLVQLSGMSGAAGEVISGFKLTGTGPGGEEAEASGWACTASTRCRWAGCPVSPRVAGNSLGPR